MTPGPVLSGRHWHASAAPDLALLQQGDTSVGRNDEARRLLIVLLLTRVQPRHCIKTGVCVSAAPRADRAGVYAATLLWLQHISTAGPRT